MSEAVESGGGRVLPVMVFACPLFMGMIASGAQLRSPG
jgi:hypothetical protein